MRTNRKPSGAPNYHHRRGPFWPQYVEAPRAGTDCIARWLAGNHGAKLDMSGAGLTVIDLQRVRLDNADLSGTNLNRRPADPGQASRS